MKVLVDASVLVYLARVNYNVFSKIEDCFSIEEVKDEIEYLIQSPVVRSEILKSIKFISASSSKAKNLDEALSFVDKSLLQTATEKNFMLITDDMKLTQVAKMNGCKVMSSIRFIEWQTGKTLDVSDSIQMLESLKHFYPRKNAIDVILNRLKSWK